MASENKLYGDQRIFGNLVVEGATKLPEVTVRKLVLDGGFELIASTGTTISFTGNSVYLGDKKVLVEGDVVIPNIDLSGYLPLTGGTVSGDINANKLITNIVDSPKVRCDNILIGGKNINIVNNVLTIPVDILVNGYEVYTTNNKPTISDIGGVSIDGGVINGDLDILGTLAINEIKSGQTLTINAKTFVVNGSAMVVQTSLRANELYEGINRVYSKANPPPRDPNIVLTNGSTEILGKQRITEVLTDKVTLASGTLSAASNGIVVQTKTMTFKNTALDSSFPKGADTIVVNPSDGIITLSHLVTKTLSANSINILDKRALSSTGGLLKINPSNEHTMVYTGTTTFRHDGIFQIGSNGAVLQIDLNGKTVLNGNFSCSHLSVSNNIDSPWGEYATAGLEMPCLSTSGAKWLILSKTSPTKIGFGIQTKDNETRFYQGDSFIRLVDGVLYSKPSSDDDSVPTIGSVKSLVRGYVSTKTTINGKPLSESIELNCHDIGAADKSHTHNNYLSINGGVLSGPLEFNKPGGIKFVGDGIRSVIASETAGELSISFKTLLFNDCSGNNILSINDTGAVTIASELKIGDHVIRHAGNNMVWKGYSTDAVIPAVVGETYAVSIKKKDSTISYTAIVTKTEHSVGAIDISNICVTKTEQRISVELRYLNESVSKFQITDNGAITTDYVVTLIKVI